MNAVHQINLRSRAKTPQNVAACMIEQQRADSDGVWARDMGMAPSEHEEDEPAHEAQQADAADADFDEASPAAHAIAEANGQTERSYAPRIDEASLRLCIARVVNRDEQALAELYEVMVGRVFGLALRITRNVQNAEEVAEDTFWQVWRQAPRFDAARGGAVVWIMTIARSRALDALRRNKRPEVLDEDRVAEAEADNSTDPEDLLDAVERKHRLYDALLCLEPLPRQLLAMAFFRGLSQEDIALQTGMPLGTVKSYIRRAQLRLREILSVDPNLPMAAP
jgi:RNA polymerase sigma-70 factor (ECF subfamily)